MIGKSVLVTGGYGNLGSYISKHLINLNYDVTILTQKERNKFENYKYKIIECNIENLKDLKLKIKDKYDYCIHCASFNEYFLEDYPKKALNINTLGTRNLLDSLDLDFLSNFIYFSTFHVYGKTSGMIDEITEINPKNDYALSHLFAEYYIKNFSFTKNLKYTIFRLTNSYGVPTFMNSNKWYLIINDLTKMAFEKKKIILNSNGESQRDFIGMNDVAIITEKVIKLKATNEIFNLSSNKSHQIIEIAKIIKKIFEERYKVEIPIIKNLEDKFKYKDLNVSNKKIRDFIEIDLKDSIEKEINKIFDKLEKNNF